MTDIQYLKDLTENLKYVHSQYKRLLAAALVGDALATEMVNLYHSLPADYKPTRIARFNELCAADRDLQAACHA